MDVRSWLETETHDARHRVTAALDLHGATSWLDYRLFLSRMYGFHVSVERALGAFTLLESVVPDADLRNNKVALIAHDLVALGVSRRDLQVLPRMPVPPLRELTDALGWMYVVERATMDNRSLDTVLRPQLKSELAVASAYLRCYGAEVETRWRELCDAIASYAAPSTAERIARAANDCLDRMQRWIAPATAADSAQWCESSLPA